MSIGSTRPMEEDATRMAYRDLIRWMASDYGFDEIEAYMCSPSAAACARNMVDRNTRWAPRS